MTPELARRVAAAVGAEPVRFERPKGEGYTHNERWLVRFADGQSGFVKAAVDDLTAEWLRDEHRVYDEVREDFLPALIGWHDDGARPVLVLEDLSGARWPPPWSSAQISLVVDALERVASTPAPAGLGSLEERRGDLAGWELVADDPVPFLSVGLCSPPGSKPRYRLSWPPRRPAFSPAMPSCTSTSGATMCASSTTAPFWSNGTGRRLGILCLMWRPGFPAFTPRVARRRRRFCSASLRPRR
jgi:hypothetical protein